MVSLPGFSVHIDPRYAGATNQPEMTPEPARTVYAVDASQRSALLVESDAGHLVWMRTADCRPCKRTDCTVPGCSVSTLCAACGAPGCFLRDSRGRLVCQAHDDTIYCVADCGNHPIDDGWRTECGHYLCPQCREAAA